MFDHLVGLGLKGLSSLKEANEKFAVTFDGNTEKVTRLEDAFIIINQSKEIDTAQKKKIVGIAFRQYCILKKI